MEEPGQEVGERKGAGISHADPLPEAHLALVVHDRDAATPSAEP